MLITVDCSNRIDERVALRAMFEARKHVFVDLLGWNIPVLDGRFEIDQFDDQHATYLILVDQEKRHLGSARLLPTTRSGILDTLFPDLCDQTPPAGAHVYEITRFCLSPDMTAVQRRLVRNQLVTAIAHFAIENGISTYTGVAEIGWLRQILAFGWDCSMLGEPRVRDGHRLGALRIDIASDTLERLEGAGILLEPDSITPEKRAA